MVRRLAVAAVLAAFAACNAIADNGKYTVCSDETCGVDGGGSSGSSGSSGTSGTSGASGSSGMPGDGGTTCSDASMFPVVAKCSETDLANDRQTDPGDARLIKVPNGDQEAPYEPNCMIVSVGQTVTWQGNLTSHPLIPRENSSPDNPIQPTPANITQVSYTFGCPGDFNFSCKNHFNAMLGTIRVIP